MTPEQARCSGQRACVAVLAVALLSLAFASNGRAGTLAVSGATVSYQADAGEQNRVLIDHVPGAFRIRDATATIAIGPGCMPSSLGNGWVDCTDAGVTSLSMHLGDMDDYVGGFGSAGTDGVAFALYGEAGDDELSGSTIPTGVNADVVLDGGSG